MIIKNILIKIYNHIIDIIFPKRETEKILTDFNFSDLTKLTKNTEENLLATAIFSYKDETVRSMIWEMKYHRNQKALDYFSKILTEHIYEDLMEKSIFTNQKEFVLISVPITNKKLKEKGFCHTDLLCKELVKNFEKYNCGLILKYNPNILQKIKETKSQSKTTSKEERMKNLDNAFVVKNTELQNQTIILIDDVITTGATIREIIKMIKPKKVREILSYTIAH